MVEFNFVFKLNRVDFVRRSVVFVLVGRGV